jgi:hypothetical protein
MPETKQTLFKMEAEAEAKVTWNRETIPKVLKIVSTRLAQRDLISLLLVSPWLHRTLVSHPSLWLVILSSFIFLLFSFFYMNIGLVCMISVFDFQVLDFSEMGNAGNRLVAALSLVSGSFYCKNNVFIYFFIFG